MEDAEIEGFLQKGYMKINNNKKSAVACGCLISKVTPFLQNLKISPLVQSNTVITSYPQQFSLSLCLRNSFINETNVSSHSGTVLSDILL